MYKILSVSSPGICRDVIANLMKNLRLIPLDITVDEQKAQAQYLFEHSVAMLRPHLIALRPENRLDFYKKIFNDFISARQLEFVDEGTVWSNSPKEHFNHPMYHRIILNNNDDHFQLVFFIRNQFMVGGQSLIHTHATLCGAYSLDSGSGERRFVHVNDNGVLPIQNLKSSPCDSPMIDNLNSLIPFIHALVFPEKPSEGFADVAGRLHLYWVNPTQCANKRMDFKEVHLLTNG